MTKINEYYNFQIRKPGPMTNDSSVLNLASSPHRFCRCPCWCSRKRPFASCSSQVAQCWGKSRCKKMCVCWVQRSENSWLLIHVNYFPVRCDQWNYGILLKCLWDMTLKACSTWVISSFLSAHGVIQSCLLLVSLSCVF